MTYTIEPAFWIGKTNMTEAPEGYNAYDYLKTAPPSSFDSREFAEAWLSENYLGDDEFGIGVEWEVVGE